MTHYSLAALTALLLAMGCEPQAPEVSDDVDCAAEDEIEFYQPNPGWDQQSVPVFGFAWEKTDAGGDFFGFGDPSVDAYPTTAPWPSTAGFPPPTAEAIDAPFCQTARNVYTDTTRHQFALHLQAYNHNYWGGQWGNWNMRGGKTLATFPAIDPTTGTTTEGDTTELPADGIAFWAKRDIYSDEQITIVLQDENTSGVAAADENGNAYCVAVADSSSTQQSATGTATAVDPNVQTSGSSSATVSEPDACGNYWTAELTLSEDWELRLLPFADFYQELSPNRESLPLNPKKIYQMAFQYKTGQSINMWMDEVFLFRYKY